MITQLPQQKSDFISTGKLTGPLSYPTGGFTLNLGQTYKSVDMWDYEVENVGSLANHQLEWTISGTTLTIKIILQRYTQTTALATPSGQPSGVTVAGSSGQTVVGESAHVHSYDHNHASLASSTPTASGGGVASLTSNQAGHTHTVDFDAFTGSTGTVSHNHTINTEYTHDHVLPTFTQTDVEVLELNNAFNASGSTWRWVASGVAI